MNIKHLVVVSMLSLRSAGLGLHTAGIAARNMPVRSTIARWTAAALLILAVSATVAHAQTDATLSALSLGAGVTLEPSFASDTTDYRARVASSSLLVSVSVTATKNDSGATVSIANDDDPDTPDTATIRFSRDDKTITVTVTAADGITEKTYTVVVVREDAPVIGVEPTGSDVLWTAQVTVGNVLGMPVDRDIPLTSTEGPEYERGFRRQHCIEDWMITEPGISEEDRTNHDFCYGSISDRTFVVDGTTYKLEGVFHYTERQRFTVVVSFTKSVDLTPLFDKEFIINGVPYRVSDDVGTRPSGDTFAWGPPAHWSTTELTPTTGWPVGSQIWVGLKNLSGSDAPPEPLTAELENVPTIHSGSAFTFRLAFSEEFPVDADTVQAALTVTGGSITTVTQSESGKNQNWQITVTPSDAASPVTLTLAPKDSCDDTGAICTADGRNIAATVAAEIPGLPPTVVTSVAITNGPGENGVWDTGETVEAEVRFSDTVLVVVAPGSEPTTLVILLDGERREAAYTGGRGTNTFTFSYTVTAADDGAQNAYVAENGLSANGKVIGDNRGREVVLDHAGTAPDTSRSTRSTESTENAVALTAEFLNLPTSLDGSTFTFELRFSEAFPISYLTMRDHAFTVTNGHVTGARRLDNPHRESVHMEPNQVWEITVQPDTGAEEVSITLPETTDCAASGAVCTEDDRPLSTTVAALIVTGAAAERTEPPLTAAFADLPASHGGETFTFRLRFSEAFPISYLTLRDHAFTVTNGHVTGARRVDNPHRESVHMEPNRVWEITVQPGTSAEDVSITLPATTDCAASGAVCTEDHRPLSAEVEVIVAGTVADPNEVDPNEVDPNEVDPNEVDPNEVDPNEVDDPGEEDNPPLPPLTASFSDVPSAHDGSTAFVMHFRLSEEPHDLSYVTVRESVFTVTGGRIERAKRLTQGKNQGWALRVAPSGDGDVTVRVKNTTSCTSGPKLCSEDGRMLAGGLQVSIEGPPPPALSVADATVQEAAGATLAFAVTLDRTPTAAVTVEYATADGTGTRPANAGTDYTATSGTLTFAVGESSKTVSVTVLDDSHDEGAETMSLTLSNPSGASIADATATGTITNTDPMPLAWLSRFGRTVGTHVMTMVDERMLASSQQTSHLTLNGRQMQWGTPGQADTSLSGGARALLGNWTRDRQSLETLLSGNVGGSPREVLSRSSFYWSNVPTSGSDTGQGVASGDTVSSGFQVNSGMANAPLPSFPQSLPLYGVEQGREFSGQTVASGDTLFDWMPGQARHDGVAAAGPESLWPRSAASNMDQGVAAGDTLFDWTPGQARSDEGGATAADTGPRWSVWGRGMMTGFNGQDGDVSLNGDVLTGLLAADYSHGRLLAGVSLSYSDGHGSYSQPGGPQGKVKSTLTGVHPYLRYALSQSLSVWGVLGYGQGAVTLTPGSAGDAGDGLKSVPGEVPGEIIETDMSMGMGAFGARATLLSGNGLNLALKSDVLLVRTDAQDTAGLASLDAVDTSRLRLALEGSRLLQWANGRSLLPALELGLRYDDGDAETGFGAELGGRVQYQDLALGLTVATHARVLLAHEDSGYEEWGLGGSLSLDPGAAGLGASLDLRSSWGAVASGIDGLWSQQTTAGLARGGMESNYSMQFDTRLGYGLEVPGGRNLLTPYGGLTLAGPNSRVYRLGGVFRRGELLELSLDAERRESLGALPDHGVMLRGSMPW